MATVNGNNTAQTFTASQNLVKGNASWDGAGGVDTFVITDSNVRNLFSYFNVTYSANGTAVFKSTKGGASGFTLSNIEKMTYRDASNSIVTMDLAIYVTSVSPVATVTPNSDIVITFNETIKAGAGNAVIHSGSVGGTSVFTAAAANLIYSGNTLTIKPTGLVANTHYYVTLDKGLVVSGAGVSTQHVFMGNLSATNTTAANGFDFTTSASVVPSGVSVATFLLTPAVAQAISDSSANVASKLDQLQTNLAKVTSISLTDASIPLTISAGQVTSDAGILTKLGTYSLAISDSSANIASNLDALQGTLAKITSITQTGTAAPLAITATQLTNDGGALGLITGAYTLSVSGVLAGNVATVIANTKVISVSVSDTSANIASNLDALHTNLAKISSITQTGTVAPLTIKAAQLTSDADVLTKIGAANYTLVISDTSANIASNLDALHTNLAKISSITQTGTVAPLTIKAAQLTSDADVLTRIGAANYTLVISDTSANIASNLDALLTNLPKITSITQSGTVAPLSININQITTYADVLTKIGTGKYSLAISDSSANIATNLDLLHTKLANITSITQTGAPAALSISATQLALDADVLSKIGAANYTLVINDTSASIASNLDVLHTNLANIISITQTGAPSALVVTVSQLITDADVLAKIGSSNYTLQVTDTGTNIANNLSNLHSNIANISSITVTGGLTQIPVSHADAIAYADVQNKMPGVIFVTSQTIPSDWSSIIGPIDISATGAEFKAKLVDIKTNLDKISSITLSDSNTAVAVTSADLTTYSGVFGKIGTYSLDVIDTAVNINANLSVLNTDLAHINNIVISDLLNPLVLKADQINDNKELLSKITGNYGLSITDTSAKISANLDNLNNVVDHITKLVQLNAKGVPAVISITQQQLIDDALVLAKLGAKYNLSIIDGVAGQAQLDALLKTPHVVSVVVNDVAANISTNLNFLNTKVAKIASIHLTDSNPIAITAKQFAADTKLLAKILPADNYSLDVSGVAAGGVVKLLTETPKYVPHINTLTIADTSANIAKNLNVLQTNLDKITSITQTGKAADLKVTALQVDLYDGDGQVQGALDKIVGNYTLAVSDTSANISGKLDVLQAQFDGGHFQDKTLIKLTDKAPVVNVNAGQFLTDLDVLNKIAGKFNINIDAGVSSAETLNFSANKHGAPSVTHFDSVTGWSSGDTITYSNASGNVLLATVHTSAPLDKLGNIPKGMAVIDTTTGLANFNSADDTLAERIVAVEKAMGLVVNDNHSNAGLVAIWSTPNALDATKNDFMVLIRDEHILASSYSKVLPGDELIKIVGVDAGHSVALDSQVGVLNYL